MRKRFLAALCLVLLLPMGTASAAVAGADRHDPVRQAVSDFDRMYKQHGIAGLQPAVESCYVQAGRARSREKMDYCLSLDYVSYAIDDGFSRKTQMPAYPYFQLPSVVDRMRANLSAAGMTDENKRIAYFKNIQARALDSLNELNRASASR